MAGNPFQQLSNLYAKPALIPGEVTQVGHLTPEDKKLLQRIGLTATQVRRDLQQDTQIFYDRYNLYHHVERCCSGNTKIWLLNNTSPTIREMAENPKKYVGKYTFSINPDTLEIEPDEITAAMKTRKNAQLVRVHLDNGKYVDVTPDHRFMLRDGTYREAQYLKPEDSLMPFYTKFHGRGLSEYLAVYNPRTNTWPYIHQHVARGAFKYRKNTGEVVHHKNFDKLNNDPSNLKIFSSNKEHAAYHANLVAGIPITERHKPDCNCFACRLARNDPEIRNEIGQNSSKYLSGRKQSQKVVDKRVAGWKKNFAENGRIYSDPETAHKSLSEGQKKRFQNRDEYQKQLEHLRRVHEKNRKSKETRTCISPDCNVTFDVHHSSKRRYCTVSCANRDMAKKKETRENHSITQSKLWSDEEYKRTQTEKQQVGKRKKVERQKAELVECLLNHKVVKVEWLKEREDTYDITTKKNHNFPLEVGVFVHNSLEHSLVGAAMELYANYTSVFSPLHNATIWITSESPTYQRELTKLLDRIGIEEKIFDWAFTAGSYGDMFVKVNGLPGQGVISVDDSNHPINISRVDHEGVLIGYYKSPLGQSGDQQKLIAPWEYVHFRLLGGKKQRPRFGDQNYSEFRTVHLLTGLRSKQVTTRYGTSLLLNALPIYRRLRLAEDSLLLARLSRGLIRYIWKLKVSHCLQRSNQISLMDGTNPTIGEMAENPDDYIGKSVLTVNEKTKYLEPHKIKNIKKTRRNAQLVRVHLDRGGKYVDCTPDHNFMLRDGTYKEAQLLKPGDSLMPYYHCLSEKGLNGYKLVYDPGTNKYRYEHRIAVGKLKKGEIPHHVDYNKLNNDPSNFKIFESQSEHCKFHHEHSEKYGFAISAKRSKTKEHVRNAVFECKVRVEWLKEKEDTYDIEIEGTPNFPLTAGVFVHNSNMEAVGELMDQYSRVLREARSLDTREGSANFDSKENPMACLRGDTQIRLPYNQTPTIKEMAEDSEKYIGQPIFSINPDTMLWEVDKILAVKKTRLHTRVVEVCFLDKLDETKRCVICTPDHKFLLSDGFYKEAQDLQLNDILADMHTSCANLLAPEPQSISYKNAKNILRCLVVSVKEQEELIDTYDISVEKNHNFLLDVGVFVHNSIEDIFVPVWNDVGDLTYEKIGGEADIRWIKDIEDLRQQLAAALRTPLPLLGAWLKEATGSLGSQAIEKADINFARMARKLQRTVRNGVKRICQIHLAYMNMDPDPNLFDIQMPEMSTAEEESLKESLRDGTDVIGSIMDIVDKVTEGDDRELDRIEIFNYCNEKFLKLEDFDLKDFVVASKAIPECKRRRDRMEKELQQKEIFEKAMKSEGENRAYPKPVLFDTDLVSYVPTRTYKQGILDEKVVAKLSLGGGWLGVERSKEAWETKFASTTVIEGEFDEDVEIGGQLILPFEKDE